jgi:ribonuclease HIII
VARPGAYHASGTAEPHFPVHENLYRESARLFGKDVYQFLELKEQLTLRSAMGQLISAKETNLRLPCYNVLLLPFAKVFEGFVTKLIMVKLKIDPKKYRINPRLFPLETYLSVTYLGELIQGKEQDYEIISRLALLWAGLKFLDVNVGVYPNVDLRSVNDIGSVEDKLDQLAAVMREAYWAFGLKNAKDLDILETDPLRRDPLASNVPLEVINSNNLVNNSQELTDKVSYGIIKPQQPIIKPLVHHTVRIGTDESGKGDYFGPLVVAGVFLNPDLENNLSSIGVKDSKINTDDQNIRMADRIKISLGPKHYYVLQIRPDKYNQLYAKLKNLNHILAWAHSRALENLLTRVECSFAIVDQFAYEETILKALSSKGKQIEIFQTAKAERDMAVAAASILARESFLNGLEELGQKIGVKLLKGASSFVDTQIKEIYDTLGPKTLASVGKTHFKNSQKAGVIFPEA